MFNPFGLFGSNSKAAPASSPPQNSNKSIRGLLVKKDNNQALLRYLTHIFDDDKVLDDYWRDDIDEFLDRLTNPYLIYGLIDHMRDKPKSFKMKDKVNAGQLYEPVLQKRKAGTIEAIRFYKTLDKSCTTNENEIYPASRTAVDTDALVAHYWHMIRMCVCPYSVYSEYHVGPIVTNGIPADGKVKAWTNQYILSTMATIERRVEHLAIDLQDGELIGLTLLKLFSLVHQQPLDDVFANFGWTHTLQSVVAATAGIGSPDSTSSTSSSATSTPRTGGIGHTSSRKSLSPFEIVPSVVPETADTAAQRAQRASISFRVLTELRNSVDIPQLSGTSINPLGECLTESELASGDATLFNMLLLQLFTAFPIPSQAHTLRGANVTRWMPTMNVCVTASSVSAGAGAGVGGESELDDNENDETKIADDANATNGASLGHFSSDEYMMMTPTPTTTSTTTPTTITASTAPTGGAAGAATVALPNEENGAAPRRLKVVETQCSIHPEMGASDDNAAVGGSAVIDEGSSGGSMVMEAESVVPDSETVVVIPGNPEAQLLLEQLRLALAEAYTVRAQMENVIAGPPPPPPTATLLNGLKALLSTANEVRGQMETQYGCAPPQPPPPPPRAVPAQTQAANTNTNTHSSAQNNTYSHANTHTNTYANIHSLMASNNGSNNGNNGNSNRRSSSDDDDDNSNNNRNGGDSGCNPQVSLREHLQALVVTARAVSAEAHLILSQAREMGETTYVLHSTHAHAHSHAAHPPSQTLTHSHTGPPPAPDVHFQHPPATHPSTKVVGPTTPQSASTADASAGDSSAVNVLQELLAIGRTISQEAARVVPLQREPTSMDNAYAQQLTELIAIARATHANSQTQTPTQQSRSGGSSSSAVNVLTELLVTARTTHAQVTDILLLQKGTTSPAPSPTPPRIDQFSNAYAQQLDELVAIARVSASTTGIFLREQQTLAQRQQAQAQRVRRQDTRPYASGHNEAIPMFKRDTYGGTDSDTDHDNDSVHNERHPSLSYMQNITSFADMPPHAHAYGHAYGDDNDSSYNDDYYSDDYSSSSSMQRMNTFTGYDFSNTQLPPPVADEFDEAPSEEFDYIDDGAYPPSEVELPEGVDMEAMVDIACEIYATSANDGGLIGEGDGNEDDEKGRLQAVVETFFSEHLYPTSNTADAVSDTSSHADESDSHPFDDAEINHSYTHTHFNAPAAANSFASYVDDHGEHSEVECEQLQRLSSEYIQQYLDASAPPAYEHNDANGDDHTAPMQRFNTLTNPSPNSIPVQMQRTNTLTNPAPMVRPDTLTNPAPMVRLNTLSNNPSFTPHAYTAPIQTASAATGNTQQDAINALMRNDSYISDAGTSTPRTQRSLSLQPDDPTVTVRRSSSGGSSTSYHSAHSADGGIVPLDKLDSTDSLRYSQDGDTEPEYFDAHENESWCNQQVISSSHGNTKSAQRVLEEAIGRGKIVAAQAVTVLMGDSIRHGSVAQASVGAHPGTHADHHDNNAHATELRSLIEVANEQIQQLAGHTHTHALQESDSARGTLSELIGVAYSVASQAQSVMDCCPSIPSAPHPSAPAPPAFSLASSANGHLLVSSSSLSCSHNNDAASVLRQLLETATRTVEHAQTTIYSQQVVVPVASSVANTAPLRQLIAIARQVANQAEIRLLQQQHQHQQVAQASDPHTALRQMVECGRQLLSACEQL